MRDAPATQLAVFGELPTATAHLIEDAGFTIGDDAQIAWVTSGAVADVLQSGQTLPQVIALEPPICAADHAAVVRAARSVGGAVRVIDLLRHRGPVQDFVAAATALGERTTSTGIMARAGSGQMFSAVHALWDGCGRVRATTYDPERNLLHATSGTTPTSVLLTEQPGLRIAVTTAAGELLLSTVDGPLLWQPSDGPVETLTPYSVPLGADSSALRAELGAADDPTRARGRAQQEVSLCRALEQIAALIGERRTVRSTSPAPPPVRGADLLARPVASGATAVPFANSARSATHDAARQTVDGAQLAALAEGTAIVEDFSRSAMCRLVTPTLPAASPREVVDLLGAAPRHAWLVRRWLVALTEAGLVHTDGERLSSGLHPSDPGAERLAEAYRSMGFPPLMADLHLQVVDRLDALIRDETQIEEILFGSHDIVPALTAYQDNVATRYLNAVVAGVVGQVAESVHSPNALRVLELGAGAGVCTSAVLERLGDLEVDYLATDISTALLTAAGNRFALPVAQIDIDTDLCDQGGEIVAGGTDVVIAANVLHNASNVDRSLRHIRRAMRPNGLLVVVESTRDPHALLTAMAFLLSPRAGERASDEAFLDRSAWRRALAGAGFAVAFDLPDHRDPVALSGQHVVVGVAQ